MESQDQTTAGVAKSKVVTPNGKEIDIVRADNTNYLKIQFKTGGELPQELTGLFTSFTQANKAIQKYINNKTK